MAMRPALALLCLIAAAPAAAEDIDWHEHVSLRPDAKDGTLGPIDPAELVTGKVSRDLDYVSLAIEAAFFRSMPGFSEKDEVVLGLEVEGVLEGSRSLRTVSDVQACRGDGCALHFRDVPIARAFRFPGKEVSIALHLRAATGAEAKNARGRLSGVSDLLRSLEPRVTTAVDTAAQIFEQVIGAVSGGRIWKYRFTLLPADTVLGAAPDRLFTAGRHVLVALPPAEAPERLRRITPAALIGKVKLEANRLVWKENEAEYQETPYLVLSVRRHRRYPGTDTDLMRLKRQIGEAWEIRNLQRCAELVRELGAAIAREGLLTTVEKQLERSWQADWSARIDAELAAKRGDAEAERAARQRVLSGLLDLKEYFRNSLETAELTEIDFRLRRLRRRIAALGTPALTRRLEADAETDAAVARAMDEERARLRRLFAASAQGPSDAVEVEGRVAARPGESAAQLRARAFDAARAAAIERAGAAADRFFAPAGSTSLESRRVTERLSTLLSDTLIVDEQWLSEGPADGGYRARLRARVVRRGVRADPGYAVRIHLSKERFREGESAGFAISATRDSHLYVLSLGPDGKVTVLFPNRFVKEPPFVRAGEVFRSDKQFTITARLPTGASEAVERVKVIALRQKVSLVALSENVGEDFQSYDGSTPLFLSAVLAKLALLDPDGWCDDAATYSIARGP
jgi:hypothetical protein